MTRNGIQEHAHLSDTYQNEVVHLKLDDDDEIGNMLQNSRSTCLVRPSWVIGALAFLALALATCSLLYQPWLVGS